MWQDVVTKAIIIATYTSTLHMQSLVDLPQGLIYFCIYLFLFFGGTRV
jgi:hypothetical protein